jgi:DNA-binding transcriptional regulator YdaS (Cro superfamily)
MSNAARSNTLRAAAQMLGGPEALAQALGVSALQADRWIKGEESVPADIFLIAVDIVERHDRRKAPRPPDNGTHHGRH